MRRWPAGDRGRPRRSPRGTSVRVCTSICSAIECLSTSGVIVAPPSANELRRPFAVKSSGDGALFASPTTLPSSTDVELSDAGAVPLASAASVGTASPFCGHTSQRRALASATLASTRRGAQTGRRRKARALQQDATVVVARRYPRPTARPTARPLGRPIPLYALPPYACVGQAAEGGRRPGGGGRAAEGGGGRAAEGGGGRAADHDIQF